MSALPSHMLGVHAAAGRPLPAAMPGLDYELTVPQDARQALARGWLWLGLLALVGSGLFSILLVLSRTPYVNQWLPAANFFQV